MNKTKPTTAARPTAIENRAAQWQSKIKMPYHVFESGDGSNTVSVIRSEDGNHMLLSCSIDGRNWLSLGVPLKAARALGHFLIHNAVEKGDVR